MGNDNLPPGVTVGMLPGNTPMDQFWEQWICQWEIDNGKEYDELTNEEQYEVETKFNEAWSTRFPED